MRPDDTEAEESVARAFVQLADTLVAEFDVMEFLHQLVERCARLPGVDAAGLLLADPGGRLRVVAASSDEARLLELFQLQTDEGPCLDCHRGGRPVEVTDLADAVERWPRFVPACHRAGFSAVRAIPMRLREQALGAMNLFQVDAGSLSPAIARIAQAFTDVATVGLVQHCALQERDVLIEQMQTALTSRVVIEQAKGVLAERLALTVSDAFSLLRGHARANHHRLADLARAVVDGTDDITPRARPGVRPQPPS
ncbi:GAF and ANTAR domain-containing protein [Pseudonocardia nigra]|uniref:GAF and ANTAR domain-containing protein n=1 Tax=Pseudonocardia nigra TaxID=1921578 RepID=UPI001C5DCF2B|nr:GAF and ANTAR domain-containing protein [Pseudonocardia nigra]